MGRAGGLGAGEEGDLYLARGPFVVLTEIGGSGLMHGMEEDNHNLNLVDMVIEVNHQRQ
jgi:hypothetical protein